MNFNEIGLKDLVLDFDSNDLQDITIVQGDTKTRGFKVLVSTNNGEIIKASSQYEMRLYGINSNYPDKSFFTKGTIDGDFYKVYISTDMASKSGKLQLQLALFEGTNALIQSRIKEVDVYRSIANGGNVGMDLVVDFGKLNKVVEIAEKQQKKFEESLVRQQAVESKISQKHTEVVQIRDGLKDVLTTENERVEAEKKRVSAEIARQETGQNRNINEKVRQSHETAREEQESTRQTQEKQRQANESTRKSEEQKRITAETNRNSAETKRVNAEKIRVENENKRISAENKRAENDATYNKNEATRQSHESTRQAQEQSRVDAESKRATSETARNQSEQTRSTKETERENAEQTRQSNEQTRVSQENTRVEAEKQRVKAENDRFFKENYRENGENERITQEKWRIENENKRRNTFDTWDKTMKKVIEAEHLHIAYADSEDGSLNFSKEETNRKYIGQYVDYEEEGSDDYTKYKWSLIKGADGSNFTWNLLKKSNVSVESANYFIAEYEFAEKPVVGETYTCTIWGNLAKEKISFHIRNSSFNIDLGDLIKIKDGVYQRTFKWINSAKLPDGGNVRVSDTQLFVYASSKNITGVTSRIDKIKLEKGTNTNPVWSPAISDITDLQTTLDKKVSSDTVKNIAIIEKGASTTNIPANTLIFEKE